MNHRYLHALHLSVNLIRSDSLYFMQFTHTCQVGGYGWCSYESPIGVNLVPMVESPSGVKLTGVGDALSAPHRPASAPCHVPGHIDRVLSRHHPSQIGHGGRFETSSQGRSTR